MYFHRNESKLKRFLKSSIEYTGGGFSPPWKHIDWVLLGSTGVLAIFGVIFVFSASRGPNNPPNTYFLQKQLLFVVVGFILMAGFFLYDYRKLHHLLVPFYIGVNVLLLLVISPFGSSVKGAQAWFALGPVQLQPSEFSKLAIIMTLAAALSAWQNDVDMQRFGMLLALVGLPMFLIMLQPDLGTVLVFVAITLTSFLIGGLKGRFLLGLILVGCIGVFGVLQSGILAQYQKDRLTSFLNPEKNTSGSTYNLNQSLVTISSGGLTGEGLFQGKQTRLRYVPEQHTDFIFTAIAEELGFVGAAFFLIIFGIMVWRIWRIAHISQDFFGTLICIGVLAMLVFHLFENVGMAMGIMPVTGIPLPFMSYGGSSLLTAFIAVGLVQSVHMHRFQ